MASTFRERLAEVLKDKGWSVAELARQMNVKRAAASQWKSGKTTPSRRWVQLAQVLEVNLEWLQTGHGGKSAIPRGGHNIVTDVYQAPIIDFRRAANWGNISGGGINKGDVHEGDVDFLWSDVEISDEAFALDIIGESMCDRKRPSPEDFFEGDKVLIDPNVQPEPGDFVVAHVGNDDMATFRKYRPRGHDEDGQMFDLVTLNPDWPSISVNKDTPAKIIGTMVEHRRYRQRN